MRRRKVEQILAYIKVGVKAERLRILRELEKFDVDEHQLVVLETVLRIVKDVK